MNNSPPPLPEMPPSLPDGPLGVLDVPKKRSKFGWILASFLGLLVLLPIVFAILAVLLPGPLAQGKTVVIPRGATVHDIAALLEKNGVVWNPLVFRATARVLAGDNLQAGEYAFAPRQNLTDVVLMLRDGLAVVRLLTIAEGLTSAEIVGILRKDVTLTGEVKEIPAEGSLLPESYRTSYGDTRASLIERMQKARRELLNTLWAGREANLPLKTPQEAGVLASLIEKETGKKAGERPRVAGVFYNRLGKGMRLQSDPTVIYAITKGSYALTRELTHDDLALASPYNTYASDGLPPKPICNPGQASLEAALHPEKNDYLYFVADGSGGHAFAKDLALHNKNVTRWLNLSKP